MTAPMTALVALFSFAALPFGLQVSEVVPESLPDAPEAASVAEQPDAAPAVVSVTGAEREAMLTDIAAALGAVETAKGRFFQTGADFSESEGNFYLRRPGRMRFEYDEPSPLLIVSDGATVAIEDRDLETQDRVPLRTTPLAMILDDEIDFESEVEVLDVQKGNGLVAVVMEDRTGETEGTLALILDAEDFTLLQWRTIDPAGGVTEVQLAGIETGIRISPRLFRIEELGAEDERD